MTTNTTRLLTASAVLCMLLSSCAVSRSAYTHISGFPEERTAEFREIGEITDRDYSFTRLFTAWGPYFVIVTPADRNSASLHIYDRSDGKPVAKALPWGDGKGEIESNWTLHFDTASGTLSCSDFRTERTLTLQIDSLIMIGDAAIREKPYHEKIVPLDGSFRTRFGTIVFNDSETPGPDGKYAPRISLLDDSGKVRARIDSVSFLNAENRWKPQFSNYTAALSPNERKLALHMYGGILDIYSVGRNSLRHVRTSGHASDPDSLYSSDMSEHHPDDIFFLNRIDATRRRIYGIFDGKTDRLDNINDIFAGGDGISDFSRIAVYDWKGRPLELIHIGSNRINAIHADEKAGVLYAIFWKDGKQYFGELKLD